MWCRAPSSQVAEIAAGDYVSGETDRYEQLRSNHELKSCLS